MSDDLLKVFVGHDAVSDFHWKQFRIRASLMVVTDPTAAFESVSSISKAKTNHVFLSNYAALI